MTILSKVPSSKEEEELQELAESLFDIRTDIGYKISSINNDSDTRLIRSEIVDYISNIQDAESLITNCLAYTDSNEETVQEIVLQIINGVNDIKTTEKPLTRESLLNDIENPEKTIKTPEFTLPKTKPSVIEVLRKIEKSTLETQNKTNTDLNIVDPFKALYKPDNNLEIQTNVNNSVIIDPFKFKPNTNNQNATNQDTKSTQNTPVALSEIKYQKISPATEIQNNFDKKLSSVISTNTTESFKRHDPYRESILNEK